MIFHQLYGTTDPPALTETTLALLQDEYRCLTDEQFLMMACITNTIQ
jgi:hypothetical protein